MNSDDINDYIPSILNPRSVKKQSGDLNITQNSVVSRCSLSLRKKGAVSKLRTNLNEVYGTNKENGQTNQNAIQKSVQYLSKHTESDLEDTLGFSAIEDLNSIKKVNPDEFLKKVNNTCISSNNEIRNFNSDTESDDTVIYNFVEKPVYSVSFCIVDSKKVDVRAKHTNIRDFSVSHENNNINIECTLIEDSCVSSESELENYENTNQNIIPSPPKNQTVAVNLEIKKKMDMSASTEVRNVLILNTNAIEELSHVIVQPPNYKLVKRKFPLHDKLKTGAKRRYSGLGIRNRKVPVFSDNLKQKSINDYFSKNLVKDKPSENYSCFETVHEFSLHHAKVLMHDDEEAMNKNSGVIDPVRFDKLRGTSYKVLKENDTLSRSAKLFSPKRNIASIRYQDIKASSSEVPRNPSPKIRNDSISSYSPRRNAESLHFSLPSKSKSNKTNVTTRNIPFYKIVAGTQFAVDAFSYGDIPNVKSYFLTHFHSDHYSGLTKSFNKLLYCTKITADLCTSRLAVNPKYICLINLDETIRIDGVEVTAIDANHCPGAIMLVFTLPSGKTLLHTGDFRATPCMESYPIFWNRDMHTIYLDTTYCNPRYDFPTQEQSLEMALHLLRQKKASLEEAGKKFSSVLIVCGTYTIGKEKFFLGIARRVGCSVWACPEKDRVLQIAEGRSFCQSSPQACQLHVVPMRDLTYEKLRAYLDSLQGAFSEVVAFKPSGWENGKNSTVQRELVTIHGIPYSEHSSFSEMIRFVKFLKPKQVVPTVDISGGIKAVQKFFPCPLVYKEDFQCQSRVTDYFSIQKRQQVPAVT